MRERFQRETRMLRLAWAGMLWAMERRLGKTNRSIAVEIRTLREDMEREFGLVAAAASRLLGPVLWWTSLREDRRLARGLHYEPETIIGRRNWVES